jgi:hypothetical protein
MKPLIVAAIRCFLTFLVPTVAYATSAQWDLDPSSGDWNTAANWTPNGVPNGPADVATFGLSNTTNISISADSEVNGIVFTPAATNPYSITVSSDRTLTLSGTGITNNSGITERFFVGAIFPEEVGHMHFTNSATAGNAHIECFGESSSVQFSNRSTVDSAVMLIDEGAEMNFFDRSTAGDANIQFGISSSSINFHDASSAGSALVLGRDSIGVRVSFSDNSTAGSATVAPGDTSTISFSGHSSAGSATITGGSTGFLFFYESSTAGSATIICFDTEMFFFGSSKGGTAAVNLVLANGITHSTLDISGHNAPGVTIGSVKGDEETFVVLGTNNLTVGSNNRAPPIPA